MNDHKRGRQNLDHPLPDGGQPLRGSRRLAVVVVIVLASALVLVGVALAVVAQIGGATP